MDAQDSEDFPLTQIFQPSSSVGTMQEQTPLQPKLPTKLIPRRPKKKANPNPLQISPRLAQFDSELVDAFDTLADLIDSGIPLVKNETEQRFFYARLQELKNDFDSLIILREGGSRRNKKSKSKTRRSRK
jgi:hypothetical protein